MCHRKLGQHGDEGCIEVVDVNLQEVSWHPSTMCLLCLGPRNVTLNLCWFSSILK